MVADISKTLFEADQKIGDAEHSLDQLNDRHEALAKRQIEHAKTRPSPPAHFDESHVAALLADPTADPLAETRGAANERGEAYRRDLEAWQGQASMIDQALARSGAEIADAKELLNDRKKDRGDLWRLFVEHAHSYLVGELQTAWGDMKKQIVDPLLYLASLDIVKRSDFHVGTASRLTIEHTSSSHSHGWRVERLLTDTDWNWRQRHSESTAVIADLRSSLSRPSK